MRAGCVWERRRRRHLLCPPPPPALHIPSGPNLSPLSPRTPQTQITQAWQLTLSQLVITHESFHTLKENFYVVLPASSAPALAAALCRAGLCTPRRMLCPDPAALCSRGTPAALPTPPRSASSPLPVLPSPSPGHTREGPRAAVPNAVGLLQPLSAHGAAHAASLLAHRHPLHLRGAIPSGGDVPGRRWEGGTTPTRSRPAKLRLAQDPADALGAQPEPRACPAPPACTEETCLQLLPLPPQGPWDLG